MTLRPYHWRQLGGNGEEMRLADDGSDSQSAEGDLRKEQSIKTTTRCSVERNRKAAWNGTWGVLPRPHGLVDAQL